MAEPAFVLPVNQFYHVAPESFASYLVEAGPYVANYHIWLYSDILLPVLGITPPAAAQKRLADDSTQVRARAVGPSPHARERPHRPHGA